MIKILFSDLDGTLLEKPQPGKQIVITDENRRALQKLEENGITFCIASGRNYKYTDNVKAEIGTPNCDVISCNGATVIIEGKAQNHLMTVDDVRLLADYCYNHTDGKSVRMAAVDLDCVYFGDYVDDFFRQRYGNNYACNYDVTIRDYLQNPDKYPPYQKMYVIITDGRTDYWQDHFRSRFEPALDFGSPYVEQMEFMHAGVNKGDSIQWFMDHYGLTLEEVASIGDADNDIPMLTKTKYSFVVSTGQQSAKDVAYKVVRDFADCVDYIVDFNKNEGK